MRSSIAIAVIALGGCIPRYDVQRQTIASAVENPRSLARAIRLVPHITAGRTIGVRIFVLDPKPAFAALGLEGGDTLTSVDRQPLSSVEMLSEWVPRLGTATSTVVTIRRRDKSLTREYRIHGPPSTMVVPSNGVALEWKQGFCFLTRTGLEYALTIPTALAEKVSLSPEVNGLRLQMVNPTPLGRATTLKDGDLLLSVNGKSLVGSGVAEHWRELVESANDLRVEILSQEGKRTVTCRLVD